MSRLAGILYEQTSITARSAEDALERAKSALESARQKAAALEEARKRFKELNDEN